MGNMTDVENWSVATDVLLLASQLVEAIQEGIARRGFVDIRPVHGFAFARISAGDATIAALGEYLGVTKQAAAQLVQQLEERGYVTRTAASARRAGRPADPDRPRRRLHPRRASGGERRR